MNDIEIQIKSTKELMHEACAKALNNFTEYAEDNLNFLLEAPREDWLGNEDELDSAIDDARDLLDDAKERQRYYLEEEDIHSLLDNGPQDEYDDKAVLEDIHELKETVDDFAYTISNSEGGDEDEVEGDLNDAIDDIRYWYNDYKKLKKSVTQA